MAPVSIIKDFPDGGALGGLREADHVLRAADLDEREARVLGNLCGEGGLARVWSSLQQDGDQTGAASQGLLNRQPPVLEDLLDSAAPGDDAARQEGFKQVLRTAQGWLDVIIQGVEEVRSYDLRM